MNDNDRKFHAGKLLATPRVEQSFSSRFLADCLMRHLACDWGGLCDEDKAVNDRALVYGGQLLSSYKTDEGKELWIITSSNRESTTFLLPEEY